MGAENVRGLVTTCLIASPNDDTRAASSSAKNGVLDPPEVARPCKKVREPASSASSPTPTTVSYTHLRAHET